MISKEVIDELKKTHAETFAAKMAVLKDEQMVASVILSQIEQEKLNPPEARAKARVDSAAQVLITHAGRVELAKAELAKVVESVLSEFPGMDLELPDYQPAFGQNVEQLITGYRNQAESDANEIGRLQLELKAAQAQVQSTGTLDAAEKDLLLKLRGCSSIKDVREAFAAFDSTNRLAE